MIAPGAKWREKAQLKLRRSPTPWRFHPQIRDVPWLALTHPRNASCHKPGHRMVFDCAHAWRKRILGRCQVCRTPAALAVAHNAQRMCACHRSRAQECHPLQPLRHETHFREITGTSMGYLLMGLVSCVSAIAPNLLRQMPPLHVHRPHPQLLGLPALLWCLCETLPLHYVDGARLHVWQVAVNRCRARSTSRAAAGTGSICTLSLRAARDASNYPVPMPPWRARSIGGCCLCVCFVAAW